MRKIPLATGRAIRMRQPFLHSFKCAFEGIGHAFVEGRNFKVQFAVGVVAVVLGIVLGIDATQWAVIVTCIGVVLGGECVNTAIEAVVDLASPDYHKLAKVAKDCAAGAVLVASIASVFVAAFVYLPRIGALLGLC